MRVVVFIVYLIFFLFRGYDYTYAGTDHNSIHYTPQQQADKDLSGHREYLLIQDTKNHQQDDLVMDEFEDEDPDTFSPRKFKLLTSYLELAGLSGPDVLLQTSKSPQPFFSLHACKYITQRVLRI